MSNTIITETTETVTYEPHIQRRMDALAFFEKSPKNCTYPKLNAYRESDTAFFPQMVYMLATRGLIGKRVLRRVLDDAWMTCPRTSMARLSQWVELYHLADGETMACI